MKTQTRLLLLVAALVAVLLLVAVPVAARATKTDVEATDYGCTLVDLGTIWDDDSGIRHIRDQVYSGETRSDDTRFVGITTLRIVSWNIDLNTGDYTMHATGSLEVTDPMIDGTWDFVSVNSRNIGGVITAWAVAHGTGDLAGLKARGMVETLTEVPDPTVCDGPPQYVSKWSLTLLDPHGE
jgi:hypothetical protein